MDFHVAAVERNLLRRIGCASDRREYPLPNASFAPAGEAIVDGLVRPILVRAVFPATPDPLHVHVIPGKSNHTKRIRHNVIERCFCRLKDFRRIATRYDKLARNLSSDPS